jgi:hypothetical protein
MTLTFAGLLLAHHDAHFGKIFGLPKRLVVRGGDSRLAVGDEVLFMPPSQLAPSLYIYSLCWIHVLTSKKIYRVVHK